MAFCGIRNIPSGPFTGVTSTGSQSIGAYNYYYNIYNINYYHFMGLHLRVPSTCSMSLQLLLFITLIISTTIPSRGYIYMFPVGAYNYYYNIYNINYYPFTGLHLRVPSMSLQLLLFITLIISTTIPSRGLHLHVLSRSLQLLL